MIKFKIKNRTNVFDSENFKKYLDDSKDKTGFLNLDELRKSSKEVQKTAKYVRDNADTLLVVGIGGSYLGGKAAIEALTPYFKSKFNIYYIGTHLSSEYFNNLIEEIKDKEIVMSVVSKSGDTLETRVFYKLLLNFMKSKYSEEELVKRVIVTTSETGGFFNEEVKNNGFKKLIIPSNIGGRFSVFSPANTLPMHVAGINVDDIFKGAYASLKNSDNQIRYALLRRDMMNSGKTVEAYTFYEKKMKYFMEWLKQLYAESLGKDNQGILPIDIHNTRDLHSLGQFIQEGNHLLFETVFNVIKTPTNNKLEEQGTTLDELNNLVSKAVSNAHQSAGVENIIIDIDELTPYNIGYLFQFFMSSCTISGYLEGVNAFNQPGVEKYKSEVTSLLKN